MKIKRKIHRDLPFLPHRARFRPQSFRHSASLLGLTVQGTFIVDEPGVRNSTDIPTAALLKHSLSRYFCFGSAADSSSSGSVAQRTTVYIFSHRRGDQDNHCTSPILSALSGLLLRRWETACCFKAFPQTVQLTCIPSCLLLRSKESP